jgi:hypothetical protein
MNIYIAGKITGLEYEASAKLFQDAETVIEKAGHTPLNPLTIVDQDDEREWEDYMLDAIEIVLVSCEAVYMLSNWRESRGARIEHAIAEITAKPIYYQGTELPLGCDWPEPAKV